ncbi:hypothetical protein BDN70DRAFT_365991 [Pholiota conissans]|uniref:Uncharacterized protein n=1 Tax=Pholiota conissans TaxID=109636 RepID=A0A9P5ZG00_9AGAR|nr:hypothetical protein BDN70DRAFT_365991 [Pholiota conissans]
MPAHTHRHHAEPDSHRWSLESNKLVLGNPYTPAKNMTPNNVITLNFENSAVLIKRPESYQEALEIAKKEYPQLAHLSAARIGFTLQDVVHGTDRFVRISESAWASVLDKLPGGMVVNVMVLPDPDAKTAPPGYLEVPSQGQGSSKGSDVPSLKHSRSASSLFAWIGTGK